VASATDLRRGERRQESERDKHQHKSRFMVRVHGSPTQPEPGAEDDEGHLEDRQTPIRIDSEWRWRDWTGTRTHIVH
jgi:hypothetical protein